MPITEDSFASLHFTLHWESQEGRHSEHYLARKANLWRDIFPPGVEDALKGARPGETFEFHYGPGELVPLPSQARTRTVPRDNFRPPTLRGAKVTPRFGRFYPLGLLQGIPGIFRANTYPFRVTGLKQDTLTADWNHPLAGLPLRLSVEVVDAAPKDTDTGGRVMEWTECITGEGPGMQARSQGQPTDFAEPDGLQRADCGDDRLFYAHPRFVGHIDRQASACLAAEYERLVQPHAQVLDLMSSVESHLPDTPEIQVTGLGLNTAEMEHNPRLHEHVLHDLNADPDLPFATNSFDTVLCSLSIEYLTSPRQVVAEMVRVLRPGGRLGIGFSNRWFPPKTTNIWADIHPFERLGLVMDYLLQTPGTAGLQTITYRNWWRPAEDAQSASVPQADPIFVATAIKEQAPEVSPTDL